MSFLTTSRRPSTTRMVINTCCCIPRRRLILAFSGRVFISSSVLFLSVGRPVRLFITSSVSRFQAPLGPLGFRHRNTLTIGTWVSFSPLPFEALGVHLSSEPWQQLTSCATCLLRRVISLVLTSRSPPLRLACVFSVSYFVRQAFVIPQDKRSKLATLREDILSSPFVSLKKLQRFSGKWSLLFLLFRFPNCMYARFSRLFPAIGILLGRLSS